MAYHSSEKQKGSKKVERLPLSAKVEEAETLNATLYHHRIRLANNDHLEKRMIPMPVVAIVGWLASDQDDYFDASPFSDPRNMLSSEQLPLNSVEPTAFWNTKSNKQGNSTLGFAAQESAALAPDLFRKWIFFQEAPGKRSELPLFGILFHLFSLETCRSKPAVEREKL